MVLFNRPGEHPDPREAQSLAGLRKKPRVGWMDGWMVGARPKIIIIQNTRSVPQRRELPPRYRWVEGWSCRLDHAPDAR